MFNTARLPRPHCDTFSGIPSIEDAYARSIVVSVHNWLYAVEVIDVDRNLISARDLESRLLSVISDVDRRIGDGEVAVPVSVLSADHRDLWTKVSVELDMRRLVLTPMRGRINNTYFPFPTRTTRR